MFEPNNGCIDELSEENFLSKFVEPSLTANAVSFDDGGSEVGFQFTRSQSKALVNTNIDLKDEEFWSQSAFLSEALENKSTLYCEWKENVFFVPRASLQKSWKNCQV